MTGTISIAASEFSVGEAEGQILVPIERTGDLSGAVTIEFATTADTATAGTDYLNTAGTVTMAAGQDRVLVPISILDDDGGEATETFVLSLVNVDSGFLAAPRTARVNILDDETPTTDEPQPPLTSNYDVSREVVVPGLAQPIAFDFAPHDPSLMYVAEKGGVIKIYDTDTGSSLGTFLDISDKVNNIQDRGLMDIAFHPDFEANPYVYAFYVVDPPGTAGETGNDGPDGGGNRFAYVVRFTADADNDYRTVVPGSETILVGAAGQTLSDISGNGAVDSTNSANINVRASDVDPATGEYIQDYIKVDSRSHAGGALEFGPDGALYVSIGDGTSFNYTDPRTVSVQDVDSLSGKILRIDPLTGQGLADNPFVEPGDSLDANSSKVYQLGLRNPFKIAFDEDGQIFISETGWNSWEEINSGGPGANYGWPYYEGGDNGVLQQTNGYSGLSGAADFYEGVENGDITITAPYRAFSHANGDPGFQVQAIVGGGSVYTGSVYPEEFQNDYFFTDVSQGEVFTVDTDDRRDVKYLYTTDNGFGPVHFQQGPDGYMYYADLVTGEIGRLQIAGPLATLTARVDDEFELYVNGVEVLSDDDWRDAETISLVLEPGDQIAVHAVDTGGPGGAFFDIMLADGTRIGSSSDWLVSETASGDWTAKGYDDSAWDAATQYGGPGADPWAGGAISPFLPGDSPGQWIWSDDNEADNEVFMRFVVPTVNTAPAAVDDTAATQAATPVTIDVLANDGDLDGDTLTIVSVTTPANGAAVIDDNGTPSDPTDDRIVYTPDDGSGSVTVDVLTASFGSGADGFAYQDDLFRGTSRGAFASGQYDGSGGQSGGGLTVTVGGINNTNITDGMSGGWTADFTLAEDAPATLTFSYRAVMDSNYESDEFAEVLASIDGTLIGQNGSDAIVRLTGDGNGGPDMDTGWVTVTLDLGTLSAGTHTLALGGYNNKKTYNDESVEFRFDDVTVTVAQDGEPFVGTDTFTYTVSDGTDTSTATVTVDVGVDQNTPPVAGDDDRSTGQDTPLVLTVADLLANDSDADGDTLFLTGFTQPANGALVDNGNGTLTYTPNAGFNGVDSFTYTVSDGTDTDSATVDLTVGTVVEPEIVSDDFSGPVLDAIWSLEGPAGTADVGTAGDEAFLQIDVPIGDFNAFNENRSARVLQDAPDGDFEVEAKFLSEPSEQFQYQGILVEQDVDTWLRFDVFSDGTQQFVFAATTRDGVSTSVFNLPIGAGEASHLRATRTGDDWALSYSADGQTWTEAGTVTFAMNVTGVGPLAGATGSPGDGPGFTAQVDYFFNTASPIVPEDGDGNTAPVANDDALATDADTALVVSIDSDLLANDSDADGDTLFLTGFTQPSNGTLVDNGNGTLTYTPNAGYSGPDSFTYTVGDGTDTATATVNLTVDAVSGPQIVSDDFSGPSLDAIWSLEGPAGTADVGTAGDEAFLQIDVPIGDFNAFNENRSARVLQDAPDLDFEVEAKFLSEPSLAFQYQGILVEQDANTWLRFDVFSDGTSQFIFAATTLNGVSFSQFNLPIATGDASHLRATRSGDDWTLSYSSDGQTWTLAGSFTFAMTVTGVGPLAGATASPGDGPGFTAQVDYFFNTASPIVPEDGDGNAAPMADNDALATDADTALVVSVANDLLANDSDADGDTLFVTGFTQPANGSLLDNGDGTLTYTPTAGFSGDDSFTYTVSDGMDTATATVTVTVADPLNTPPVAQDDTASTDQDTALVVSIADLLSNDNDADGDTLFLTGFTQPANGTLIDNGDGTLTYTPNAGYSGPDSFTYTISDGTDPATATVNLTVDAASGPEIISDDFSGPSLDAIWSLEGPAGTADVGTAGDEAFLQIDVPVGDFNAFNENRSARVLQDAPDEDFEIEAKFLSEPSLAFQYQGLLVEQDADTWIRFDVFSDGTQQFLFAATTVNGVSFSQVNLPIGTGEASHLRATRAGDDWTLSYSSDGQTWTVAGTFTFAMTVTAVGPLAGTTASPGDGPAFTAQVDYFFNTASPIVPEDGVVNAAPEADDDALATAADTALVVSVADDLLGNDSDADGDTLFLTGFTQPANGTLLDNGDGTLTYTPDAGFSGDDSFTYTISDGTDTATATVTVTVADAANTPPGAQDDTAATAPATPVTIDVLANDGDLDGDALAITSVSDPANGTAVIDDNGTPTDTSDDRIVYTPDSGSGTSTVTVLSASFDGGADGFTYQDDLFRGTSRGAFASGEFDSNGGQSGGGLEVTVGGINNTDITNGMSGGWTTSFTLDKAGPVTLTFKYRAVMDSDYESDEFVEVLAAVDGTLVGQGGSDAIARLTGNGNGGPDMDTGWVTVTLDLGTLSAGTHTLALGGYNNKKTYFNESTDFRFDDVEVTVTESDPDFTGTDTFTYTVSDGTDTDTATVTVTVADAVNTPPVAADDSAATPAGTPVAIDVLANDSDADGDTLTVTSVSDPANGTAVIDDNGTPDDPTDDRIVYTPDAGAGQVTVEVLAAGFDGGAEGFTYQDDLFRGTSRPDYASGSHGGSAGQQGGGLEVELGGVDGRDITDGMSGGWTTTFTLDQAGPATLTFSYRLEMSERYDPGEFSEVLAAVDGTLIGVGGNDYVDRLEGLSGSNDKDTGWVTVTLDLGTLDAGTHSLALGGFNNKKTTSSEETSIRFDDVSVKVIEADPGFLGTDSFTYTISDGTDTSTATVDVTVGGTAVIAAEDFEGGAQGWSDGTTTDGGAAFTTFLGRFDGVGEQTSKSFAVADGADQVEITFDFYELDSWDGDAGDRFSAYLDGVEIFSEDFFHAGRAGSDGNDAAASGSTGSVAWSIAPVSDGQSDLGFGSDSADTDQIHQVTLLLDNPGAGFTLGFGSSLDQEIEDESFGIDNLVVTAIDLNGDMLLG